MAPQSVLRDVAATLQRDGFAFARNYLQSAEALRTCVDEYEIRILPYKDYTEVRREVTEHMSDCSMGRIVHIANMYEMPELASIVAHPELVRLASSCLGGVRVRPIMNPELFDKPPYGNSSTITRPHQDNFYFEASDADAVVALWIALDEAGEDAGLLRYIEGSHLRGLRKHELAAASKIPFCKNAQPSLGPTGFKRHIQDLSVKDYDLSRCAGKTYPGDVLLHHGLTIHFAPTNMTDGRRRGLAVNYVAEQVAQTLADGFHQPALAFQLLDDGSFIGSLVGPACRHLLVLGASSVQCALADISDGKESSSFTIVLDEHQCIISVRFDRMQDKFVNALVDSGHSVNLNGADLTLC